MSRPRALACPASLKGVLSAREAAAALADGLRTWAYADELPVADGGEGTLDALHAALGGDWHEVDVSDAFGRSRVARWLSLPDRTAAVEAAEAIPLDPEHLDAIHASSRGLGQVIGAVGNPRQLLVCLGGTATVDGGRGLLAELDALPAPARVACDVDAQLVDAARVFAAQKGATPEQALELEARLAEMTELGPYAQQPGAGAGGGLGAAFAYLGGQLVSGAELVLDLLGFEPSGYDLVVTGEGAVDASTRRGKAPGEVARRCVEAGVRCVVFGGRVRGTVPGVETVELSGEPLRAAEDLRELGVALEAATF
jgi:glycerate 2-kinase